MPERVEKGEPLTVGTMVQQMTVQMRTKRVSVLSQASQAARMGDTVISGIVRRCLANRSKFWESMIETEKK